MFVLFEQVSISLPYSQPSLNGSKEQDSAMLTLYVKFVWTEGQTVHWSFPVKSQWDIPILENN